MTDELPRKNDSASGEALARLRKWDAEGAWCHCELTFMQFC